MPRSLQHARAVAIGALCIAAMSTCDRKPSSPPPRQYTPADAAADAAAARRIRESRRIPRDGGDPTVRFSPELEPFLGVWCDERSGLDAITIARRDDGTASVVMHGDAVIAMVVDRVRLEQGRLFYEIGSYWLSDGPNPMAGAEGLPVQCELSIDAENPDVMLNRMSSEVLDREAGVQSLRRRSPQ